MDIVTDLASEAVSYITVLQDVCKSNLSNDGLKKLNDARKWHNITSNDLHPASFTNNQLIKISEIVWFSGNTYNETSVTDTFFKIAAKLLKWLAGNLPDDQLVSEHPVIFNSPFFWRQQIRHVLYETKEKRLELVRVLEYMPLQIILTLSEKNINAYFIRLYQVYKPSNFNLFNELDCNKWTNWWQRNHKEAKLLLIDDHRLLDELINKDYPLPFETLFMSELNEISSVRKAKAKDVRLSAVPECDSSCLNKTNDPLKKAGEMQLMGLAFSGGGIRSATFNLGLIQKLASLNVLHRFDYISTVSGGGYIGSWLNSWVMRSASISKVTDRLRPESSADPMADEVRPVRWLRMFSNYLSPNVGLMSPDAWASGMTWLRNTIVNQVILLLLLLSVLSFITDLSNLWVWIEVNSNRLNFSELSVSLWSVGVLLPGAVLISTAMRSFYPPEPKASNTRFTKYWDSIKSTRVKLINIIGLSPHFLVGWVVICAFLISSWFYADDAGQQSLNQKLKILWPCGVACFLGMLLIAFRGNYHKRRDLKEFGRSNILGKDVSDVADDLDDKTRVKTVWAIFLSSLIAGSAFVLLLALAWVVMQRIRCSCFDICVDPEKLALVVGVPLLLEVLSLTVVIRMAIMGNLFPDYRREWWGRIGGLVHRFILIWLLVSSASLIMPDALPDLFNRFILFWGGWGVIIGWAVKKAYESKPPVAKDAKSSKSYVELFIRVAPYLFMIGFLLIGSKLTNYFRIFTLEFLKTWDFRVVQVAGTLFLALVTFILSSRVGVNEFSLHHFYRNRLTRAYLGATRRRADRKKSANAFTGFDTSDDMLLSSLQSKNGYVGLYPIINTALNSTVVSALDRQDRMAESFIFSPLYCGYDFSPTRTASYDVDHVYEYGYRPTLHFSNENGGPTLGTAMAISGAAVNPNWGYHSSAPIAFLLTVFNVRLGWWIGNPRLNKWKNADPEYGLIYLVKDLIGKSDINADYVCLSDGGHFDNMGLYELVRRRCSYILLGDGEQDDNASCEGLANAIRRCRIDFGVEINIDISKITQKVDGYPSAHIAKGNIIYPEPNQPHGTLIYIKTVLTGDEPVDVREYAMANPTFPQQSTADQFFDEAQFESYRKLGYHSIENMEELHLPPSKKSTLYTRDDLSNGDA